MALALSQQRGTQVQVKMLPLSRASFKSAKYLSEMASHDHTDIATLADTCNTRPRLGYRSFGPPPRKNA